MNGEGGAAVPWPVVKEKRRLKGRGRRESEAEGGSADPTALSLSRGGPSTHSPCLERKSKGEQGARKSPGDGQPGGQGRTPSTSHSPACRWGC